MDVAFGAAIGVTGAGLDREFKVSRSPLKLEKCPFYLGFLGFYKFIFKNSSCYGALFILDRTEY